MIAFNRHLSLGNALMMNLKDITYAGLWYQVVEFMICLQRDVVSRPLAID